MLANSRSAFVLVSGLGLGLATASCTFDIDGGSAGDSQDTYSIVRAAAEDECSETVIDGTTVSDAAGLAALTGVTRVRGDLLVRLEAGHDIASLDALRCLSRVDGELELSDTSTHGPLIDLNPLSRLTLVGRLYVNIGSLQNAAFPALTGADGDVKFVGGGALALDALSHVGGMFFAFGNVVAASLPMLNTVGGDLVVLGTDLQSFDAPLVEVGGRLSFDQNDLLANVGALASLRRVGQGLRFTDNDLLERLDFPELREVGRGPGRPSVNIEWNTALRSFTAPLVELVGRMVFRNNGDPDTHLTFELPELTEIGPTEIADMRSPMPGFSGFPKLEVVHGGFALAAPSGMVRASFGALRQVQGWLYFGGADLKQLELPELVSTNGFTLSSTAIETFVAPKLAVIAGNYYVMVNRNLKVWTTDVLRRVTGDFALVANGADSESTTFSMSRLAEVRGAINIQVNPKLFSLDGFPSLANVGKDFSVRGNVNLPTCEATELLAQIQAQNPIGGRIIILENLADACGS